MSLEHIVKAIKMDGLTQTEKLILILIANNADSETGEAYPSHNFIAKRANCARETVLRVCKSLTEKGLLSVSLRTRDDGSRTSNLVIVFPVIENHAPPDQKSHPGVIEPHNNNLSDIICQIPKEIGISAGDLFGNEPIKMPGKSVRAIRWIRPDFPNLPKNFQSEALRIGLTQTEALDQYERFSDHWSAKSGKDGTKLDWTATWRTWCRNFFDRRGGRPSGGQGNGGGHRPSGGWSSHLPRGYDDPQGGANGGPTIIEGEFTTKR